MTNPHIDLPKITAQLESLGFEARTKLEFKRGFVDIRIVDGFIPENTPQEFIKPPFFRISMYEGDLLGSFTCDIQDLTVLDY